VIRSAWTADYCISKLRLASNGKTMNANFPKDGRGYFRSFSLSISFL
jgi:hypothetical protein